MPHDYSLSFSLVIGKQREILFQFRVQRRLKHRIEGHQDIMSCLIGRSYFGRTPRNVRKPRKVRAELWLDTIDGVVDGGVQNRKIAS